MSEILILGDWGNSRLRLWRLENGVVAERREGPGISRTGDPPGLLAAMLRGWPAGKATLCGMAGARNGVRETPYVPCPADFVDWTAQAIGFEFGGRTITIAPGLAEPSDRGRPDVMRGEETQAFGAMALDPALAVGKHLLLLPGTHSKWVGVEDGRIGWFTTHMSGELFELLENSTLFTVARAVPDDDDTGFADGLARSAEGCDLTAALFEARAAQLSHGRSPGWARGFVSGLLIGVETRSHTLSAPGPVVVIGDPDLTARYGKALAHWGVDCALRDGEECAIAGLRLLDADD